MNRIYLSIVLSSLLISCHDNSISKKKKLSQQSQIISDMIDAVNNKDPYKYVAGFSDSVEIYVERELKLSGKENLKNNRAAHFKNHPNVVSEIQHLVDIDNKVILHDKVWLNTKNSKSSDIVEIFTFKNKKVIRVDVIQPKDLFN